MSRLALAAVFCRGGYPHRMPSTSLFLVGMAVCLLSAALMIADVVDIGWGAALGMLGIGILGGASARRTGR